MVEALRVLRQRFAKFELLDRANGVFENDLGSFGGRVERHNPTRWDVGDRSVATHPRPALR